MISLQGLDSLLLSNVVDLRFVRRHPGGGRPSTRRMLCTKSAPLLNSTNGRVVLNYRPPSHPKQLNEAKNNALVVWDIIMQDYRVVPVESVQIINQIPANDQFWEYFNEVLLPMSGTQKLQFINS